MDYWQGCISEAFDDAGITATAEQINTVASWAEVAHDNYSMAHGYDADTQATRAIERIKRETRAHEEWVLDTEPCKNCTTSGRVIDGWGRDQTCYICDGKGRHK